MGKWYTVKGGARGAPVAPVTIWDIAKARADPNIQLTTSPFGLTKEELESGLRLVYVKTGKKYAKPCPWKGLRGSKFWEEAAKHGRLKEGLEKAINISRQAAGTRGVGIAPDGRIMPLKAIKQMELAGKA